MSSPTLRDQVRRLQRENERLTSVIQMWAIDCGISKTAAYYLFDVVQANNLDKYAKIAAARWPFLVRKDEEEKSD